MAGAELPPRPPTREKVSKLPSLRLTKLPQRLLGVSFIWYILQICELQSSVCTNGSTIKVSGFISPWHLVLWTKEAFTWRGKNVKELGKAIHIKLRKMSMTILDLKKKRILNSLVILEEETLCLYMCANSWVYPSKPRNIHNVTTNLSIVVA